MCLCRSKARPQRACPTTPPPPQAGAPLASQRVCDQSLPRIPYCFFPDWSCRRLPTTRQPVMPDDHSESVPPLPIPNRTVKRLHADDSADSRVKVGNRQAPHAVPKNPTPQRWGFCVWTSWPIGESLDWSGLQEMLDNSLLLPHNRKFSTEGCPSG